VAGDPITADRGAAKSVQRPATRKRLLEATKKGSYRTGGGEPRKPTYENMYVVYSAVSKNPTVAELAAKRNQDPVEVMMDLAIESDFNQLFMQFDETRCRRATKKHSRLCVIHARS
jgi:hypothetical protein